MTRCVVLQVKDGKAHLTITAAERGDTGPYNSSSETQKELQRAHSMSLWNVSVIAKLNRSIV